MAKHPGRYWIGYLILCGLGAGLVVRATDAARTHPALPILGRVPPFVLTDQTGQSVRLTDLRGTVWVADFIFTRCAGQCPLMSAQMARLADTVTPHEQVKLVSFTVDPGWDTPDVLARYATSYGASSDQWLFLTGDHETIVRLCQEGFRLSVGTDDQTPEEPIAHSVRFVLIDQEGAIRGYYDATDATQRGRLNRDLRTLLKGAS